jgi:pimeloyl-ACP methyl ester carboxylesterase
MLPKLFAPATYARRPEAVARMERVMRGLGPDGVAAALLGMAERPDATAFLSRIVCPALVLVGEHDTITPAADSEAIATAIPGARLTVIPEAGHMAPVENPEAVNAAIRGFLGAIGSGRA